MGSTCSIPTVLCRTRTPSLRQIGFAGSEVLSTLTRRCGGASIDGGELEIVGGEGQGSGEGGRGGA